MWRQRRNAEGRPHAQPRRAVAALLASVVSWLIVATSLTMLLVSVARAHEIGTTRVVVSFSGDVSHGSSGEERFVAEIETDAGPLIARLERARSLPRANLRSVRDAQQRLDTLCVDIVKHLSIAFDGMRIAPTMNCHVDAKATDPNTAGVFVAVRGVVPSSAKTFQWRYDLTAATYALTIRSSGGADNIHWLEGDEQSSPLSIARVQVMSTTQIVQTYFGLGFTHILPLGLDHILFVVGLSLLSRRLKPILLQVSAFTVAHTITLGLTMYGVIALPSGIVEPLIALSIVYVAIENLVTQTLHSWRIALVFAFGLLHGMGFASALRELSLPPADLLSGLVSFNVGVEVAQLTVVACVWVCLKWWTRNAGNQRHWIVGATSAGIALTGMVWTIERIMF